MVQRPWPAPPFQRGMVVVDLPVPPLAIHAGALHDGALHAKGVEVAEEGAEGWHAGGYEGEVVFYAAVLGGLVGGVLGGGGRGGSRGKGKGEGGEVQ